MHDETVTVTCPTCGKDVAWRADSAHRPFCSERCQLVDLGEWAAERYRVPGEPAETTPGKPDTETLQ